MSKGVVAATKNERLPTDKDSSELSALSSLTSCSINAGGALSGHVFDLDKIRRSHLLASAQQRRTPSQHAQQADQVEDGAGGPRTKMDSANLTRQGSSARHSPSSGQVRLTRQLSNSRPASHTQHALEYQPGLRACFASQRENLCLDEPAGGGLRGPCIDDMTTTQFRGCRQIMRCESAFTWPTDTIEKGE
ncbi:uncharacterized protein UV8b_05845 [Ustilaginoidea virens]|uniref:Uncharacterized protein n=1 Tax=Ustilaginoidea virens TaxID=1159556 RepID=A0A8E5MJ14_USTVR|nr:uncharacterized protein UV8b_05845 [Ustilaginoidea virens]QUC21602.1 hypothetical protein UV8b_05845 [Ustilaginoidea virens]